MTAKRLETKPGEYFLGGKGVIIFRGFKKKPSKPDEAKPPKDEKPKE